MAILHIVFGSLGLITACCVGGGTLLMQFAKIPTPGNPQQSLYQPMIDVLDREAPNHLAIQMSIYGLEMFLLALLIVGGIGLIGMRGWARVLVILASTGGIVVVTASCIWTILVLNPAMQKAQAALMESVKKSMATQNAAMPNMSTFEMLQGAQGAITASISAFPVLYCLIAIVTMLLPSVSRAFAGTGAPAIESNDYYDPPKG